MARTPNPALNRERQEFAARLRTALGERSHGELAEAISASPYTVDGWCCGRAIPSQRLLERLAKELRTTASWLRSGITAAPPRPAAGVSTYLATRLDPNRRFPWTVTASGSEKAIRSALRIGCCDSTRIDLEPLS